MSNNPSPKPEHEDELVHADDSIIGKAVRKSLLVLVVIAVLFGGTVYLLKRKPAAAAPKITELNAPVSPDRPQAEIPVATFTDITRESGITFIHNDGAYGEKLLPETMGGGVAFFDYDNDGAQDLLLINSTYWPAHVPEGKQPTTPMLFRNDGNKYIFVETKSFPAFSGIVLN